MDSTVHRSPATAKTTQETREGLPSGVAAPQRPVEDAARLALKGPREGRLDICERDGGAHGRPLAPSEACIFVGEERQILCDYAGWRVVVCVAQVRGRHCVGHAPVSHQCTPCQDA